MINSVTAHLAALHAIPGIGRQKLRTVVALLRQHDATWQDWWRPNSTLWSAAKLTDKQCQALRLWLRFWSPARYNHWLHEQQINVISASDNEYPELLRHIVDAPVLLYWQGKMPCWSHWPVAVVGTRRMTSYGQRAAQDITLEMAELGATIVSGLMYGVDSAAHRAALQTNAPTVGVLGYGLHFKPHLPASTQQLWAEILASQGCLVSEYRPAATPTVGTFPNRNRIIAGMSLGVVVIEAAQKSGSKNTAQHALDNGRSVFAVPGPITSPYCEGTKQLLKQGAICVSSGREVLEELGLLSSHDPSLKARGPVVRTRSSLVLAEVLASLNPTEREIIDYLQGGQFTTDQFLTKLAITLPALASALAHLELAGVVQCQGESWSLSDSLI